MLFPKAERNVYSKNTLKSVICQLRFPGILEIDSRPPIEFQKLIRDTFPFLEEKIEGQYIVDLRVPPSGAMMPGADAQQKIKNWSFESLNRDCKVNLTKFFISLSTSNYLTWERFYEGFEKVKDSLEQVYSPPFYTRLGLRYTNVISRKELGLDSVPWNKLLNPSVLGLMQFDDSQNIKFFENGYVIALDVEGGKANLRIGNRFQQDAILESCVFLDGDFYFDEVMVASDAVKEKLGILQQNSRDFLEFAITQKLRNAMEVKQ